MLRAPVRVHVMPPTLAVPYCFLACFGKDWTRGVGGVYHVSIEEKFSSYTLALRGLSRVTRL